MTQMNMFSSVVDAWKDPSTGFDLLVVLHPTGLHYCGYALLPMDHPAVGMHHNDPNLQDIDIHGGVTFSEAVNDEKGNKHWVVGFDCAQSCDYCPGYAWAHYRFQAQFSQASLKIRFRTINYVRRNLLKLAQELTVIKELPVLDKATAFQDGVIDPLD